MDVISINARLPQLCPVMEDASMFHLFVNNNTTNIQLEIKYNLSGVLVSFSVAIEVLGWF